MTLCGPACDTVLSNQQTRKLNFDTNYINNLLTSTVRAVWENFKPRSCCIDRAIARSIQQDRGLIHLIS